MINLRSPRTAGEPGTAQRTLVDLSSRAALAATSASLPTSRRLGLLDAAAMLADQAAMVEDFADDSTVVVELSDVAHRLTTYANVLDDRGRASGLYDAARTATAAMAAA